MKHVEINLNKLLQDIGKKERYVHLCSSERPSGTETLCSLLTISSVFRGSHEGASHSNSAALEKGFENL